MTTEEMITELQTRLLALQRAMVKRMTRENIATLSDQVNTQMESVVEGLDQLREFAAEVSAHAGELADQLEEHIHGS